MGINLRDRRREYSRFLGHLPATACTLMDGPPVSDRLGTKSFPLSAKSSWADTPLSGDNEAFVSLLCSVPTDRIPQYLRRLLNLILTCGPNTLYPWRFRVLISVSGQMHYVKWELLWPQRILNWWPSRLYHSASNNYATTSRHNMKYWNISKSAI